jgi:subtilisin family serine protease
MMRLFTASCLIFSLLIAGCGDSQTTIAIRYSSSDANPSFTGEILVGVTDSPPRTDGTVTTAALGQLRTTEVFLPGATETGRLHLAKPQKQAQTATTPGKAALRMAVDEIIRLKLPEDTNLEQALNDVRRHPDVLYAEPNYRVHYALEPDDPAFFLQWALANAAQTIHGDEGSVTGRSDADINATDAWEINTGDPAFVVAIIDTGLDLTHPDLADNLWQNLGESGLDSTGRDKRTNGVDDDGNGYVDDVHGWDFVNQNHQPQDDDPDSHGTHVAGIIGARGNNAEGIAGINWRLSLMPLKGLDARGDGDLFQIASAYTYAIDNGARVVNASYAYPQNCNFTSQSQTELEVLTRARDAGVLVVAAAGNFGCNNDLNSVYPGGYDLDNILSVAATDPMDQKVSWSNYGANTVDLGAPGINIYSTVMHNTSGLGGHNQYDFLSGTSMAAPQVSGAAALLWSLNPQLSYLQIREALLLYVDQIPSLQNKVASQGRLNIGRALANAQILPPPEAPQDLSIDEVTTERISLSWRDLSDNETAFVIERSTSGADFVQRGRTAADVRSFVDFNVPQGAELRYRVKALAGLSSSPYSNMVQINTPGAPEQPSSSASDPRCFIATAAWGSPLATEVVHLRRFRDQILLPSPLGQQLVATYYRLSPTLAAGIARHDWLRALARVLLQPLVWLAKGVTSAEAMETRRPPPSPRQLIVAFKPKIETRRIEEIISVEKLRVLRRQTLAGKELLVVEADSPQHLEDLLLLPQSYHEISYVELNQTLSRPRKPSE